MMAEWAGSGTGGALYNNRKENIRSAFRIVPLSVTFLMFWNVAEMRMLKIILSQTPEVVRRVLIRTTSLSRLIFRNFMREFLSSEFEVVMHTRQPASCFVSCGLFHF